MLLSKLLCGTEGYLFIFQQFKMLKSQFLPQKIFFSDFLYLKLNGDLETEPSSSIPQIEMTTELNRQRFHEKIVIHTSLNEVISVSGIAPVFLINYSLTEIFRENTASYIHSRFVEKFGPQNLTCQRKNV